MAVEDGVYCAVLTPLNRDLSCNKELLATHCFDVVAKGCRGVALFGTTGEGSSFSLDERIDVLTDLIQRGFDPKKIILANGSSSIADSVALAQAALRLGCDTNLISPPCFFKGVTGAGVAAYYREIIQRVNDPRLRVILYHIPQNTCVPITLEIIQMLREEFPETVIGMKESEKNLPFTQAVIEAFPGFKVYVGNEKQIIEAVHLGAAGSICGIANLYPELICSLFEMGKKTNSANPEQLEVFFRALEGYSFIPTAKLVLTKRTGKDWARVRPPLMPLDPSQAEMFFSALKGLD